MKIEGEESQVARDLEMSPTPHDLLEDEGNDDPEALAIAKMPIRERVS